ncbi:hypothetical protein C2E21_5835 [Chlorella sorokiniana]|uniref:Uncharacterized protein n=1 Tax=Chlorella sorokiniana TaxID=3076 RepID=A0A2P6TM07_CHLSO|nr:hypothetical protein C2E21_5835 [Chlorella sorokiniana]|eukprot:PRW45364.1 hypothetical protein C2E21_5835 [Chlorella sorokiniana]
MLQASGKENQGRQAAGPPPSQQQQQQQPWQPAVKPPPLDVRAATPAAAGTAWAPPISCPSRLCGSPSRSGSCSFDPFEAPGGDELPGCTPLCAAPRQGRQALPPAVHRKPGGGSSQGGSPVAAARLQPLFTDRVQSCPPERTAARPGRRPVVRLRVKRSLNGAVAAAGGPTARRSLDVGAGAAAPLQQLAGCSRKRFEEADLLSPPMPRKSSRTLLDEQQAADMMSRLALAGGGSSGSGDMASQGIASDGTGVQPLMAWEAPQGAAAPSAAALTAGLRSVSYP